MPIANLGSKGLLRKGVLSPILVCNKDSVQQVCVVRLASSSNAYIGMILYVYSVSYTHLVNSRLTNMKWYERIGTTRTLITSTNTGYGITAVSYTHLDVYKRQYFMQAMLSNAIGEQFSDKLRTWYDKFGEAMKDDGTLDNNERKAGGRRLSAS